MASEYQIIRRNYVNSALQRGFMEVSPLYEGSFESIPPEEIEENPCKYIITECLDACKTLWSKNIFTYGSSGYNDEETYIEIALEDINPENQDVVASLQEPYFKEIREGIIRIGVKEIGVKAKEKLDIVANLFLLQDVPENKKYIDLEEALIICGCNKTVPNPHYISIEELKARRKSTMTDLESLDDYLAYKLSDVSKKEILAYDPSKTPEDIKSLLAKHGFLWDGINKKPFRSIFFYQRHCFYSQENLKRRARETSPILSQEKKQIC